MQKLNKEELDAMRKLMLIRAELLTPQDLAYLKKKGWRYKYAGTLAEKALNKKRKESKEADNGFALEAIITEKLLSFKSITPTARCKAKQEQDQAAINRIDEVLKQKFEAAGLKIASFISDKYVLDQNFEIDRADDGDDSVEDIILVNESKRINFSIKHNNDSLRHNRPYSLVQNCLGFDKGSAADLEHRNRLQKVCDDFRNVNPNKKYFRELEIDAKEDLYFNLVKECEITMLKFSENSTVVRNYFNYIMGNNYIKIKLQTKKKKESLITYEDFTNERSMPNRIEKLKVYRGKRKGSKSASWNLEVYLDNGYIFKQRIHNGDSEIKSKKQIPMKFDVKFSPESIKGSSLI